MIHPDDAAFEADIACAIAKLESMKLAAFPADLYALMWAAAYTASTNAPASREMFEQCARECADNFAWPED